MPLSNIFNGQPAALDHPRKSSSTWRDVRTLIQAEVELLDLSLSRGGG